MTLYPLWLYLNGAPIGLVHSDEEKAEKRAVGWQLPPGWPDDGLGSQSDPVALTNQALEDQHETPKSKKGKKTKGHSGELT